MALVQKLLIRHGIYQAPQGEFVATPKRLKGMADRFQAMKKAGIRVPAAWGHQPQAVPCDEDDKANKQYYLSKFNAGYIEDLIYDPKDGLSLVADVPGAEVDDRGNLVTETTLPDGRKVKSAIGEVSAAVRDWKDGKGRNWPDSIIHVALTPLPVVPGQDGFRELSAAGFDSGFATGAPAGLVCLSQSNLLYELSEGDMAEEKPDEKEKEKPEPKPEPKAEEKPPEAPPPIPEKPAAAPHFAEAVRILQELGLHLPPDTTPENLAERVCVAGHALLHSESEDEDEEEEEEPGAYGEDEPGGGMVQEEQRPIMMSLSTAQDPMQRKMLEREQARKKGELIARVDRLVKRGLLVVEANSLKAKIGGYELSLDSEGDAVAKPVETEIALLERVLPRKKFGKRLLGTITEEKRPSVDDVQVDEKELEERAARFSTPAPKKWK